MSLIKIRLEFNSYLGGSISFTQFPVPILLLMVISIPNLSPIELDLDPIERNFNVYGKPTLRVRILKKGKTSNYT